MKTSSAYFTKPTHKERTFEMFAMNNARKYTTALQTGLIFLFGFFIGHGERYILEERCKASQRSVDNTTLSLPPCGDICSYNATVLAGPLKAYPQLKKDINCRNIMGRMAFRNHVIEYPPPKRPPRHLRDAFLQNGEMRLQYSKYKISFGPSKKGLKEYKYSYEQILDMIEKVKNGQNINEYDDRNCILNVAKKYSNHLYKRSGVVIGTLRPWLEATLLAHNVGHITTLEYLDLKIDHPQSTVDNPYSFAEKVLAGKMKQFDFAASYSSVEHSGLGRYGDPINPYGDLEAVAQVWCMVKPGGLFILGVPMSYDGDTWLKWNAQRSYGIKRLQHLTANWELEELLYCNHHLMILTKPKE